MVCCETDSDACAAMLAVVLGGLFVSMVLGLMFEPHKDDFAGDINAHPLPKSYGRPSRAVQQEEDNDNNEDNNNAVENREGNCRRAAYVTMCSLVIVLACGFMRLL